MTTSNPAETYESYMVPPFFAPWADRLIAAAGVEPGQHILDVACGTGIVARRAAAIAGPSGEVAGLDLNPDMLAVAQTAAAREGVDVTWHEGRAENLPFADGHFDQVLCQFALMFFTDRRAALGEMRRVLKTGGRVGLIVFQGLDRHPFYQSLNQAIERQLGMTSLAEIFAFNEAEEPRALLTGTGFRDVTVEPMTMTTRFPDPPAFLAGEIAVDTAAIPSMQHLDAAGRARIIDAISAEMAAPLATVTEDDHVVLPYYVFLTQGVR